jgi:predicted transposase YbfD/YdcC
MPGEKVTLTIPLDAAGIEDFKPDLPVKVVLQDRKQKFHSKQVKLDRQGIGAAAFGFATHPGSLSVFIGPGDATDEEMLGLQTLSFNVSRMKWGRKTKLTLRPVRIKPYYWWWWHRWCRTFIIRGRLECPDGSPVPGAEVCAYDVDWWFRWSSTQQVGCAVTNIDGAFEMKFRWCCGWWPWWWWRYREWRLDPLLAMYISKWLKRHPELPLLPTPDNQPTLAIFNRLLAEEGLDTKRQLTPEDISRLEKVRPRLLEKLPPAPELERLRIWPWYPWHPWRDCSPDIIFKATQDCVEVGTVILDEGALDTRWNIPTTLDVTLVASEAACCREEGQGLPCDDERCLVYTRVCNVDITQIGGNDAADPTPEGYAYPNHVTSGDKAFNGDRPFGGIVNVTKNAYDMADVDYYTVAYDDGTGWKPLPPGAGRTLTRRWMYHDGTDWHSGSRAFPYDTATFPGFAVYESREHFENNGPYSDWYPGGSRFWVSNEFMIFRLNSAKFPDGTYHFQVTGYEKNAAGNLVNGAPLPFCCTPDDNDLVLTFDNRVIDPMLDTASNPCSTEITNCTVHMCTTEPTTDFLSVSIDGVEVDPCGVVEASTGMLEIVFEASDPGNHLGTYTLFAKYGENGYVNLLNLLSEPGASLTAASGDKSNEITAIPELIKTLALEGAIVTIDAMGCQKKITQTIIEEKADYVIQVKDNQQRLHEDIALFFQDTENGAFDTCDTIDGDHGRIETRQYVTTSDIDWLPGKHLWAGIKTIAMAVRQREIDTKVSTETSYFISSLENHPPTIAKAIREHWGIENGLHWCLDIAFREDDCRVRKDYAPENLGIVRHMAINLLKRETSLKGGIQTKRLKAAWDHNYLLKVLDA